MRYVSQALKLFAENKIVLIAGPRQVGKTTVCSEWASDDPEHLSLNWDIPEDRERILHKSFFSELGRVLISLVTD